MSQDLARIRAFVQVFDAGGFSSAARVHGRSKALLSKYVTDLEDYLGVRLMNRTTRKLSLTEDGTAFLPHLLDQARGLVADIGGDVAHRLAAAAAAAGGRHRLAPSGFRGVAGRAHPALRAPVVTHAACLLRIVPSRHDGRPRTGMQGQQRSRTSVPRAARRVPESPA